MVQLTELMNRLFSEASGELASKLSEKVEEAKANGASELKDSENDLALSKSGGDVLIEDKSNGEVTKVESKDDGTAELKAVTKTQSDATLDDAEVKKIPDGLKDGIVKENSTVPEVKIVPTDGVTDKDKSGTDKAYSVVISNLSKSEAEEYIKSYSNNMYEENKYYSDANAVYELSDFAQKVFSYVDELDETCSFSEYEEAFELIDALYSEIEEAKEAGVDTNELSKEAGKAEATVEAKAEKAGEAQEAAAQEDAAQEETAEKVAEFSNRLFSAVSEFSQYPDYELAQAIFSESNDLLDYVQAYSDVIDFSDVEEYAVSFSEMAESYILSQEMFSDEQAEDLANNTNELAAAGEEMKETGDPELAKKVKVLADSLEGEAEIAQEAGVEGADEVKAACRHYSEEADKVLEEAGESVEGDEKAEEASSKEFSNYMFSQGSTRSFSNSCLTSTIN